VVGKSISENKILEIDSVDPGLRYFYNIEIVVCFQSHVILVCRAFKNTNHWTAIAEEVFNAGQRGLLSAKVSKN